MDNFRPNPPPAANPAVAVVVYSWLQWRGVAEEERWVKSHAYAS